MRALRILLITAIVLGVLFVAADRLAVNLAESEAAEQARQTQGLSSDPVVVIGGFPFLTQVVAGKLDNVKITVNGVEAGTGTQSLRIDRFSADLRGVELGADYSSAVADTATGSVLIGYADLTKATPEGVTVAYGGEGRVKVSGGIDVGGQSVDLGSVLSEVSVSGGDSVTLKAVELPALATTLGLGDEVREQIDFTQRLQGLPGGITLKSVRTDEDGITVAAAGTGVVLAG